MRAGEVRRGEQAEFPVPPGSHNVRATIDAKKSGTVRVETAVGQPVHLTVEPGGSFFQSWQVLTRERYLKLSVD